MGLVGLGPIVRRAIYCAYSSSAITRSGPYGNVPESPCKHERSGAATPYGTVPSSLVNRVLIYLTEGGNLSLSGAAEKHFEWGGARVDGLTLQRSREC